MNETSNRVRCVLRESVVGDIVSSIEVGRKMAMSNPTPLCCGDFVNNGLATQSRASQAKADRRPAPTKPRPRRPWHPKRSGAVWTVSGTLVRREFIRLQVNQ